MAKKGKYTREVIRDDGVEEKKDVAGSLISLLCILMSIFLAVIGIFAYIAPAIPFV